jgi:hypothetical protein
MRDTFGYSEDDDAYVHRMTSDTYSSDGSSGAEDAEPMDVVEASRIASDFRPSTRTLYVVDYEPSDLMFPDRTAETAAALVLVAGAPAATVTRLAYDDAFERDWVPHLGAVHLFPSYIFACHNGVYRLTGSFLRQMYILQRVTAS